MPLADQRAADAAPLPVGATRDRREADDIVRAPPASFDAQPRKGDVAAHRARHRSATSAQHEIAIAAQLLDQIGFGAAGKRRDQNAA